MSALVLGLCVGFLVHRVVTSERPTPDNVGPLLDWYHRVSAEVPSDGRIGFLSTVEDSTAMFVAQHALAPRLLVTTFDDTAVVITGPGASAVVDQDPRLVGFRLQAVSSGGVRVYRRQP